MAEKGQVQFQAAVLPDQVLEKLTIDDTPDLFYNYFWEFMGVDIQNADIKPWDFENVLDMVDIAFCEILEEFAEETWDKVVVIAYKTYLDKDGKQIVKEAQHAYHVSRLWSSLRAKLYVKMCRAREGFALKQLTESKGHLSQHQKIEGLNPGMDHQEKKGGWRL